MSNPAPLDLSTALRCFRCGYDVRAQSADGVCPECGTSVEESRQRSAMTRRPAWRESDPRWRRRMLAGAWVLVLVPAMAELQNLGWTQHIPVPTFSKFQCALTLEDSLFLWVYVYFMFCIGVVLLFSQERGRPPGRLDWTRRWGVITTYIVLLLGIPHFGLITSLVLAGIGALFQSIPIAYQPASTDFFVKLGTRLIWYGPQDGRLAEAALMSCSSIAMLLACVPLYDALRRSGSKRGAMIVLAPLALSAVFGIGLAVQSAFGNFGFFADFRGGPAFFFYPYLLFNNWDHFGLFRVAVEVVKWLACVAIALWLTRAQIAALRQRRASPANDSATIPH